MEQNDKISAIHIRDLNVNYRQTLALENICLDVNEGDFLGVIGPNGGGKSTLLKAILGLEPIKSGVISVFGHESGKSHPEIGYVPQFALMDRSFPISVLEAVMTAQMKGGLHPFFKYKAANREKAMEKLQRVGISELANRQISELSGGEFQRMLIARALAAEPKILLLDEPTASVDPSSRAKIYELLTELNKDITIVLVTHDLMAVASQITSLACLNGRLVYHGEPKVNENILGEMYGCPVELIAHGVPHRVLGHHDHGQEGRHIC